MHLPVIVGFGGLSPAGRSSSNRGYERLVYELLDRKRQLEVLESLGGLTGGGAEDEKNLLKGTLIRRIMRERFDTEKLDSHVPIPPEAIASIRLADDSLTLPGWKPGQQPHEWVPSADAATLRINRPRALPCHSAGQLPAGFAPGRYYASRQHPLALEMTVFGMSDALGDLGLDWEQLHATLKPDRIAVISGSAIGQIDERGVANYNSSRLLGSRVSASALAMGLGEMSADFINAYVLGTCAVTGNYTGACATWLYNLSAACNLIRSGQIDLAVVGAAESQVNPYTIEAFHASSALASDEKLLALQRRRGESTDRVNHRHACRPFADNVGMVVGEAAQFAILMSDRLALETGADIRGAALATHIHADGVKSSITRPGVGNYLTVAKALAQTRAIVGEEAIRHRSVMLAHGTGTPQNRTTESHILSYCAGAFGIENWPVVAIKSMLGHSMACSSGDQAMAALGITEQGLLPGIPGADEPADDVVQDHLDICFDARQRDPKETQVVFLNAKGFGGNNATTSMVGAETTLQMLEQRHGSATIDSWRKKSEHSRQKAMDYDANCRKGQFRVRYMHGESTPLDGLEGDVRIADNQLHLKGFAGSVDLDLPDPFAGYD